MKALAALILAGTISTGEFLIAGFLLGGILLIIGGTRTIRRIQPLLGEPVVRGIQLGVAFVLLETGVSIGLGDPWLAALALVIAVPMLLRGYVDSSAMVILVVGAGVAIVYGGYPTVQLPPPDGVLLFGPADLSFPAVEATAAQFAMTLGNACLAASVLLGDYFDRDISPDHLAGSMGVMNLVAVPFGAFPMCHGSGGIAGKYAFGARTAGSNVILGVGYILIAILAVGLITAYPLAMLGVILVVIASQLAYTSLQQASEYWLVIGIAVLGVLINLGLALVFGVLVYAVLRWRDSRLV
jgi:MFS superfamily sulfate permease-like transporter